MTTQALRRATTIAELREKFAAFPTPEGEARWRAFVPRPDDVLITPFAKCGTTWVQQIVHGLRARGSMDFSEITAVVPWLEMARDLGIDLDAEQAARPRAFKSHLSWDRIPKGARYINVFRDPRDALVSMYNFLGDWYFETSAISLTEFALQSYIGDEYGGGYWGHTASWWRQRRRDDVLLLCCEHMRGDLPGTVRRIADFIGVALDDELFDLVVRQSGIDFMSAHAHHFDDHLLKDACDEATGLPPGGESSKVNSGESGRGKRQLAPAVIARMDELWHRTMTAEFGLASYADLQDALRP